MSSREAEALAKAAAKAAREIDALAAREAALKHLRTTGAGPQSIQVPSSLLSVRGDNTLRAVAVRQLQQQQHAAPGGRGASGGDDDGGGADEPLPEGWTRATCKASGAPYYWSASGWVTWQVPSEPPPPPPPQIHPPTAAA